jgi:polyadenylate-binding protein
VFGNVVSIDIKQNSQGKKMDYGWIRFESRDDVKDLLDNTATQPIIIEGKAVTIEKSKT